jgi:exodeoxyribonuclease VII large subunit
MSSERKIFSLKQVSLSIQKTIQERYTQLYWVQAEMHKLNQTPRGHCFPELVEKENDKLVAEMRATIWGANYQRIVQNFYQVAKEPLRDGMNLLFLVKITFHPLYGMGLEIQDIDPTFTLGALQKEREETLKKLTRQGILNRNQLLPFPLLPKRIALISIDSSKGLSDFYAVIKGNPWKYSFFFMLFPSILNGDGAVKSIQNQLKRIEKVKHHFDAVAIIRGGGGEIGLSCYNHFDLCKAIACFPLPVLTGIGHSTNVTVAELVSYRNAITPTELADFLIQSFHAVSQPVDEALQLVKNYSKQLLFQANQACNQEIRIFRNSCIQRTDSQKKLLLEWMRNLHTHSKFKFLQERKNYRSFQEKIQSSIKNTSKQELEKLKQSVFQLDKNNKQRFHAERVMQDDLLYFLKKEGEKQLEQKNNQLTQFSERIRLLDPENVLKRGYAYLKNAQEEKLKENEEIQIVTYSTELTAEIKTLKKRNHG